MVASLLLLFDSNTCWKASGSSGAEEGEEEEGVADAGTTCTPSPASSLSLSPPTSPLTSPCSKTHLRISALAVSVPKIGSKPATSSRRSKGWGKPSLRGARPPPPLTPPLSEDDAEEDVEEAAEEGEVDEGGGVEGREDGGDTDPPALPPMLLLAWLPLLLAPSRASFSCRRSFSARRIQLCSSRLLPLLLLAPLYVPGAMYGVGEPPGERGLPGAGGGANGSTKRSFFAKPWRARMSTATIQEDREQRKSHRRGGGRGWGCGVEE